QRQVADGTVDVLEFDRYPVPLGRFTDATDDFFLKASDRYLFDLFFPDRTSFYDQKNLSRFLAEAHARLSSPLLNIAMAMIGLAGVLVEEFSRRGYTRRMMLAAGAALLVRLLALAINAACIDKPQLNVLQYALPLGAALIAGLMLGGKSPRRRRKEE